MTVEEREGFPDAVGRTGAECQRASGLAPAGGVGQAARQRLENAGSGAGRNKNYGTKPIDD